MIFVFMLLLIGCLPVDSVSADNFLWSFSNISQNKTSESDGGGGGDDDQNKDKDDK